MRIFLIGFMGTGKTTVGAKLAEELGWRLCDSDAEIVSREGRTIPELFAAEGEAYFRDVETSVLADLADEERTVITTGGGVVLREQNRTLMRDKGLVVALTAQADEIVRRVQEDPNRPLLQTGQDLRTRVEELLAARAGLYEWADVTIDTTGRGLLEITHEIVRYWSASSR